VGNRDKTRVIVTLAINLALVRYETSRARLSHVIKDRLMQKYPQRGDVIIHIEPPPHKTAREVGGRHGAPSPPAALA
jgi:hypothetical protein